jgi:hypothetical protein
MNGMQLLSVRYVSGAHLRIGDRKTNVPQTASDPQFVYESMGQEETRERFRGDDRVFQTIEVSKLSKNQLKYVSNQGRAHIEQESQV